MAGLNLLVFRDGRRLVRSMELRRSLFRHLSLGINQEPTSRDASLAALLRAGELECAVCDAAESSSVLCQPFQALTDHLAESLLHPGSTTKNYEDLKIAAEQAPLPETLTVSTPEGFAYYGLHPLAYSDVLHKLTPLPPRMVVVGIRTIGTTLSAVCCAAACRSGVLAERLMLFDPVIGQCHSLCGAGTRRIDLRIGTAGANEFGKLRMSHR